MAKKADQKLDMITEQLKALDQLGPMGAKIDAIHSSLGALKEEVGSLTFAVNSHEDRITALEQDMSAQKEMANAQQQVLRSLTLRLLDVPPSLGEAANNYTKLRELVYTRFLLPLLHSASLEGDIPNIPPSNTIINSCFRPDLPIADKQPPPVIIKVANKQLKVAIMKNRKELPSPSPEEVAAGITRFILIEDLTPDNHRALSALSKSKLTAKVWSVDGRIKFIRADKPNVIMTVKSVYDSVEKMISD